MFGVSLVFFVLYRREAVLAQAADFSLSLIPIGETTFTRAHARDIYIDTCIDSIRCVRLILTNLLLSSPSSSSRAVLFFLGSVVVFERVFYDASENHLEKCFFVQK